MRGRMVTLLALVVIGAVLVVCSWAWRKIGEWDDFL